MNVLHNYLDSMFLRLPDVPEARKAKEELGQMMEDKYTELLEGGMSENEAVGTVLSEFGSLDELAEELGINHLIAVVPNGGSQNQSQDPDQEKLSGTGAADGNDRIIDCYDYVECDSEQAGAGGKTAERYDYTGKAADQQDDRKSTAGRYDYTGQDASPYSETQTDTGRHDYSKKSRRQRRAARRQEKSGVEYSSREMNAVMSVYWPTVLCIYLIWSFLTFEWGISWIIWPAAAIAHKIITKICGQGGR